MILKLLLKLTFQEVYFISKPEEKHDLYWISVYEKSLHISAMTLKGFIAPGIRRTNITHEPQL